MRNSDKVKAFNIIDEMVNTYGAMVVIESHEITISPKRSGLEHTHISYDEYRTFLQALKEALRYVEDYHDQNPL